jgi:pimeloyl-ACP methyl ester carboxylesterase
MGNALAVVRREFSSQDGLRLVADAYGDADAAPVILLHGGGQTRHAWQDTAEALARGGFYALALDQRGHGESQWSDEAHYQLDWFAADLKTVARSVQRGLPPVVVGASLGGLAGLLAEGESDEPLLRALVLVDVAPRLELAGVARIIGFMKAHPEGFASLDEAADAVAGYLPHRPRPRSLTGLHKNLRVGADARYRWHWDPRFIDHEHGLTPEQFTERMVECARRLQLPTLLVRGALSDVLSAQAAQEFRELVPHAEIVDVSDAAHMVAGDRNDRFTQAVLEFLANPIIDGGS